MAVIFGTLRRRCAIRAKHLVGHVHRIPLNIIQLLAACFEFDEHHALKITAVRRKKAMANQVFVHPSEAFGAVQIGMVPNPL
jgi:hypothetical protein